MHYVNGKKQLENKNGDGDVSYKPPINFSDIKKATPTSHCAPLSLYTFSFSYTHTHTTHTANILINLS